MTIQLHHNFFNSFTLDNQSRYGKSYGFHTLFGPIGFDADYAFSKPGNQWNFSYFNAGMKIRFYEREDDRNHYFRLGVLQFNYNQDYAFQAVDPILRPPTWDSSEASQTYWDYNVLGNSKMRALEIGYERIREVHTENEGLRFVSWVTNPVGQIIGWIGEPNGHTTYTDLTSAWKISLYVSHPSLMSFDPTGFQSAGNSSAPIVPASANYVIEPRMRNLMGFRIQYLVQSTKLLGWSLGIETGMMPGYFNIPGVYGRGFPDDNIYFKINMGIEVGYSNKNRGKS